MARPRIVGGTPEEEARRAEYRELKARQRAQAPSKAAEDMRNWRAANPDAAQAIERRRTEREPHRVRDYRFSMRTQAREMIAAHYGRPVECMIDMTPERWTADEPCQGQIEIDHIDGGGLIEYQKIGGTDALARLIVSGVRQIVGLRLLCRFHNLRAHLLPPADADSEKREKKRLYMRDWHQAAAAKRKGKRTVLSPRALVSR